MKGGGGGGEEYYSVENKKDNEGGIKRRNSNNSTGSNSSGDGFMSSLRRRTTRKANNITTNGSDLALSEDNDGCNKRGSKTALHINFSMESVTDPSPVTGSQRQTPIHQQIALPKPPPLAPAKLSKKPSKVRGRGEGGGGGRGEEALLVL